jgi:polysaccharide pyruvyl transferase WcaK-like protein
VLALSYQRKVDVLMKTMSMSEYCLAIDQFTAEQAVARFGELVGGREAVSDRIDDRVSTFRNEVERQYDEVLAPRTGPA